MKIKINRTISDPPPRDYSRRSSAESKEERTKAYYALRMLKTGQSVEFTGEGVTRSRINALLKSQQARQKFPATYATARIPGGIGVWRVL